MSVSTRWPDSLPVEEALQAQVIHAKPTEADEFTLCEEQGTRPLVPRDSVCLILDDVDAGPLRHTVNCPGCVEWMHS